MYNPHPIYQGLDQFAFDDYSATLHVPAGSAEEYKLAPYWGYFNVVDDLSGIDDISDDIDPTLPMQIYNQHGVPVGSSLDDLIPGIYIVRQIGKTKKIYRF